MTDNYYGAKSVLKASSWDIRNEDNVNHPAHYNFGRVETIEYIEDCIGAVGLLDYCVGNALKYISRAKYKGKYKEDLRKAVWYLNKAIETYELEYEDEDDGEVIDDG